VILGSLYSGTDTAVAGGRGEGKIVAQIILAEYVFFIADERVDGGFQRCE
jgi:hypothetical protein